MPMNLKSKIIIAILSLLFVMAAISSVYNWYKAQHKPTVSNTEYVPVPEIKTVTKIKRIYVPGPERIITYEKEKIVQKLKLPNWVAQDADEQIIATGEIEPYEGKTDVVATLNTKSGAGNIIAKQRPLSFLAFENKKEVGARAGYTTDEFKQLITVFGRWQFFRVGAVHAGLYAEGNSQGEAIGQLELNYKF